LSTNYDELFGEVRSVINNEQIDSGRYMHHCADQRVF